MAMAEASITGVTGETDFVGMPIGRGYVGMTGTMSAGTVKIIVRPYQSSTNYVTDSITTTVFHANTDEPGTGYSFFEQIAVPRNAQVKLAADASFAGSLTAVVIGDEAE